MAANMAANTQKYVSRSSSNLDRGAFGTALRNHHLLHDTDENFKRTVSKLFYSDEAVITEPLDTFSPTTLSKDASLPPLAVI